MGRTLVRDLVAQLGSLLVAGFVLLSIFAVYTGSLASFYILLALAMLGSAVALRYVAFYHPFSKSTYRKIALVPAALAFLASAAVTVERLVSTVTLDELTRVFQSGTFRLGTSEFLPEWWVAIILALAGGLILVGALRTRDLVPYPKPGGLRSVALSPVYFGLSCSILGLWAVLFVGIAIQRIVVIAPIFEELLKFGVALLVGSTLFGRSVAARIGVALVVGSLFGLVEHATTYPTEADANYLFRTAFHSVTTILSVTLYTLFAARGESRLQWIAPAYSMLLHFFYNTFVVLAAVLGALILGSPSEILPLLYGGAAITLALALLVVAALNRRAIVAIHRPLEDVLSELV